MQFNKIFKIKIHIKMDKKENKLVLKIKLRLRKQRLKTVLEAGHQINQKT
jgi:hypothetical protein